MRQSADLNNMSWRVRLEEVILEPGKPFGSKLGLQKLTEVSPLNVSFVEIWSQFLFYIRVPLAELWPHQQQQPSFHHVVQFSVTFTNVYNSRNVQR